MYNRHEMLDVVIVDGKARGIIAETYYQAKLSATQHMLLLLHREDMGMYFSYLLMQWGLTLLQFENLQERSCKSLLHSNSSNLYSCFWWSSVKTNIGSEFCVMMVVSGCQRKLKMLRQLGKANKADRNR